MKEKWNKLKLKIKPFLTPTMFVSFALAWMITNGWAYVLLAIGIYNDVSWAKWVGTTYLAFIWMPWTPEKLVTIPLSFLIQKLLFGKGDNKQ
jgi:hypothetical protein